MKDLNKLIAEIIFENEDVFTDAINSSIKTELTVDQRIELDNLMKATAQISSLITIEAINRLAN